MTKNKESKFGWIIVEDITKIIAFPISAAFAAFLMFAFAVFIGTASLGWAIGRTVLGEKKTLKQFLDQILR